ncbi:23S rRNA (guanosine(2251)-2'-O)-methyltransferase RlmB [Brevibacillus sp. SYP-B805]|uniref:23S rRNA (guanosine(2251)-2'-O)-methyltransferase RlmB n=1 Tax=Brevibacillus sp. SYP-B805 TaxID=1578199 RepID=UPI0013ED878F|nr:23S rRNA (guanosine(2251)-2'-O)-methyltransferase RlmB [Brevibacillus sp. SYP-B805]NGQ97163.1 23S rRNA (guanosine(2251)-2'-O)-methyltransferase RlmB [Brevibacillus sp. SYP-B805]
MSEEWIVGKNPVIEALRSGRTINKIWIAEGANRNLLGPIFSLAREQGVVISTANRKKLDQLSGTDNHQGVIASVAAYDYAEVDDLLARAKEKGQAPFLLILDELEDPHNLGSILRTADAVGAHGVIIPKRRSVNLTATVAKASAGAVEYVPVARVTNLVRTIEELKEQGVWIAGTDASARQDFREGDFTMPLALVIGSEGRGISRLVRESCDFLFRLPMVGHVTSLNASVAAALLMYEVFRARHPLTLKVK